MTPLPTVSTQLNLTPSQRIMAYTVVDQLDAFLSKERWLKGGWFNTNKDSALENGYHTECLANFIRRVELGGPRINADEQNGRANNGEGGGSYAEMRSVTEGVIATAIRDLYPGEVRHMHFVRGRLEEMGHPVVDWEKNPEHYVDHDIRLIDPEECTSGHHGGPCPTCKFDRYKDEVTVQMPYGPFVPSDVPEDEIEADTVIPNFNDALGTRYADVQRVIDRARELISGVQITNAADVMDEQERMEVELASIDAQADIDTERVMGWFSDLEERGWVKRHWTKREAERRVKRIRMRAEKEKEVVREDCVNCA